MEELIFTDLLRMAQLVSTTLKQMPFTKKN